MIAVIQRVKETKLSVEGRLISHIPHGLVVFLGVKIGDTKEQAQKLAKKVAKLRIFSDENDKMNLSVQDVGGEVLLVSQFTLCGDCSHGNRPSFSNAEQPALANELYLYCAEQMRALGLIVKTGVFGADMKISQLNDGPVSILYEL